MNTDLNSMKGVFVSLLTLVIGLTPLTVPLIAQRSWGETQNPINEETQRLLTQAEQQTQQGLGIVAIETYQKVLAIVRQLKDKQTEGLVLQQIGFNYSNISQLQEALDYYNQALPILREVGNRRQEAITLSNMGLVYQSIGEPQKALEYYNQSLAISIEVGNRTGEGIALSNIGVAYKDMGEPQKALEYHNQALLIAREVGNRAGEGITLNNIGSVYGDIGEHQKELDYYNQALPVLREVRDRRQEAVTLSNIGMSYEAVGEPQKALEYYNQSLPIAREVRNRSGEATTLNNIGYLYQSIGQALKGLEYFKQAVPIFKEIGDYEREAVTLNNIGSIYQSTGELPKALEYFTEAVSIFKQIHNREREAITLNNIGSVYQNTSEPQKALEYFNQALPILRQVSNRVGEGVTLTNIGFVYQSTGQPQKALEHYNQALDIFQGIGDYSRQATVLNYIAVFYQNTNRPTEAIPYLEQSANLAIKMRGGLLRENRQMFLQNNAGRANTLASLLIDQKQLDKAYEWVNRFTTADLIDYTRLINAKVANPQAQQEIDQWKQKNQQLEALRQEAQNKNYPVDLVQQIRELEAQSNKQAEDIYRRFPEVTESFETQSEDIAQLRASIPQGTVVVQPVLLTNMTNIPDTIAIFVISKDNLTVTKKAINPNEFDTLITQYRTQLQNAQETDHQVTGEKLYDFLIRPVEAQIQSVSPKQLSIIATGRLRYIPFETLYNSETDQYLIQEYPVNYLTRLSSRSLQQAQTQNAALLQGGVLALGNPVPDEKRKLPAAEAEVNSIKQILPNSEVLVGSKATLETFKTQAPRFSFLHLATHGCFQPNSQPCEKLGLKPNSILFADQQLNIADAALLGLKNTELLTLSACQTALETNSNGEEIAGVAYLFERAGARAVMASLWNIRDDATKEIMIQFYQILKQPGMTKGEALQQAKLKVMEMEDAKGFKIYSHPHFWSPLILIGDAR